MNKKSNTSIQMIADFEGDISKLLEEKFDGEMPILATRDMVAFTGVINPIIIGRETSTNLIKKANKNPDMVFAVICQKKREVNHPLQDDL